MRPIALVLVAALAACSSSARLLAIEDARAKDEEAVAAREAEIDGSKYADQYLVVQDGDVAATARTADEAVRAAAAKSAEPAHRYVFRPADRATPLYRMAYLAEGGVVVGRRFLADVGLEVKGAAGAAPVVRHAKSRSIVDLRPTQRLAVEVATLDGAVRRTIEATYDPDFDGGLLVPVEVAGELALERFELPGDAEVQVALGRPFRARRATALATVASLSASGAVEVVYENKSPRK